MIENEPGDSVFGQEPRYKYHGSPIFTTQANIRKRADPSEVTNLIQPQVHTVVDTGNFSVQVYNIYEFDEKIIKGCKPARFLFGGWFAWILPGAFPLFDHVALSLEP